MAKRARWQSVNKTRIPFAKLREAYAVFNKTSGKSPHTFVWYDFRLELFQRFLGPEATLGDLTIPEPGRGPYLAYGPHYREARGHAAVEIRAAKEDGPGASSSRACESVSQEQPKPAANEARLTWLDAKRGDFKYLRPEPNKQLPFRSCLGNIIAIRLLESPVLALLASNERILHRLIQPDALTRTTKYTPGPDSRRARA